LLNELLKQTDMENTVLVHNAKGKRVELVAEEADGTIVLYRKNDTSPVESKRRIIVQSVNEDKLVEFMSAQISLPKSRKSAIRSILSNLLLKR